MATQTRVLDLARLKEGSDLEGDCGSDPRIMPEWMDVERFKRGQQFFVRHSAAVVFALHCSLTMGFAIINLLNPLVFTNLSDTPQKSFKRYLKTLLHLYLWHTEDVWNESTVGHRSTQHVRSMHKYVRRQMSEEQGSVVHISQYDMGIVQAGFMAVAVMYPEKFGIKTTTEELEDYIFFWRGIGYLLGIDDRYNVCGCVSYSETYSICKEIEQKVMLHGFLVDTPEMFLPMADAYITGSNIPLGFGFKVHTKESVLLFSMEVIGSECSYTRNATLRNRIRVFIYKSMCCAIRWLPGFEKLLNYCVRKMCRYSMNLVHKQMRLEL